MIDKVGVTGGGLTPKVPSSMVKRETSKVPLPKSKMRTFLLLETFLSRPYAMATAVGSLMI